MRRLQLLVVLVLAGLPLQAKDVYLFIAGSVGNFRTDTRVFNPSFTKDIVLRAAFLTAGDIANHPSNNGVSERNVTVPRRSQVVFDDVGSSLFGITGSLGAIRFVSSDNDDFIATQRIYAAETTGTLGQFVPGKNVGESLLKGVIQQLKATGASGTRGTFRTNIGFVSPVNAEVAVTLRLFGRNNTQIGATRTITLRAFGLLQPLPLAAYFPDIGTADLTDAWVSYSSGSPVFGYASVLDNGTQDPIFIPASSDTGVEPPAAKSFDVSLQSFSISVSPSSLNDLKVGDSVVFRVTTFDGTHGFILVGPDGDVLIPSFFLGEVNGTVDKPFTVKVTGTHTYFCTNSACGAGHGAMSGTFSVRP